MDKIIVTNLSALTKKYGDKRARLDSAISKLIAADAKRGMKSKLVALDDKQQMTLAGGVPVNRADNVKQVKDAIDAVYSKYRPDYLMILGGPDVIPHQLLPNPAYDPGGDDDKFVPCDLPYACDAPFGTKAKSFLGPTRVVGRMPDLINATDPRYLIRLLGTAARWKSRSRKDFARYFAISAEQWRASTELTMEKLFGHTSQLQLSPPKGPKWKDSQLATRLHFINCHGGASDPHFYGQRGEKYPIAHSAVRLKGKISNGAVIAAECCYGAQLYDPSDSKGQAGICSTYLADGAYGFFGSSTIAYGPSEGNGQADLICQYFVAAVLNGASLGRATLEARHLFAQAYNHLDPMDLKTMLQFHLLGDPSIHPIASTPHSFSRSKTYQHAFKTKQNVAGLRAFRRERILQVGSSLQNNLGAVVPSNKRIPKSIVELLRAAAKESGIDVEKLKIQAHDIDYGNGNNRQAMKTFDEARSARQVYSMTVKYAATKINGQVKQRVMGFVATVQNRQIIHLRRVHSR